VLANPTNDPKQRQERQALMLRNTKML